MKKLLVIKNKKTGEKLSFKTNGRTSKSPKKVFRGRKYIA